MAALIADMSPASDPINELGGRVESRPKSFRQSRPETENAVKTNVLKVIAAFVVCLSVGCTGYESTVNTHLAREYLTEDLEDQIMFNLIRGMNGLPIVHYDIGNIQSAIAAKVTPQVGGGVTTVHNNNNFPGQTSTATTPGKALSTTVTTAVGAASTVLGTVTRPFTWGVGAERDNNITITVSPVFDEPKIYAAYAKFLNIDRSNPAPKPAPKPSKSVTTTTTETETETGAPKPGQQTPPKKVTEKVTVESNAPKAEDPEQTTKITHFGNDVQSVATSDSRPDKNDYLPHTLKYWNRKWYFVRPEYIKEFSELSMAVVARSPNSTGSTADSGGKKTSADVKVQQRILMDSINRTQGVF